MYASSRFQFQFVSCALRDRMCVYVWLGSNYCHEMRNAIMGSQRGAAIHNVLCGLSGWEAKKLYYNQIDAVWVVDETKRTRSHFADRQDHNAW